jgi:hypothetical protein
MRTSSLGRKGLGKTAKLLEPIYGDAPGMTGLADLSQLSAKEIADPGTIAAIERVLFNALDK